MKLKSSSVIILCLISSSMLFCKQEVSCQDEIMLIHKQFNGEQDIRYHWYSYGKNPDTDSVLIQIQDIQAGSKFCQCLKASTLMKLGARGEAAKILKNVMSWRLKESNSNPTIVIETCEVFKIKI
jgi:hypothetical protein